MSNSVLIIDDSGTIRERIIKTLESFNLFSRYYEAEDGLEEPVRYLLTFLRASQEGKFGRFRETLRNHGDWTPGALGKPMPVMPE